MKAAFANSSCMVANRFLRNRSCSAYNDNWKHDIHAMLTSLLSRFIAKFGGFYSEKIVKITGC